jgi:hypothetical protein
MEGNANNDGHIHDVHKGMEKRPALKESWNSNNRNPIIAQICGHGIDK